MEGVVLQVLLVLGVDLWVDSGQELQQVAWELLREATVVATAVPRLLALQLLVRPQLVLLLL